MSDLVPVQQQAVALTPAERVALAAEQHSTFERIKRALLGPQDLYVINGKQRVLASGWEVIATAANISVTITSSERFIHEDVDGTKFIAYAVTVRGSKDSRVMDATGRAQSNEQGRRGPRFPKPHNEHNIETLAHTRAKNRVICALAGGQPSDNFDEVEAGAPTVEHRQAKPITTLLRMATERGIVSTPSDLIGWCVGAIPSLRDVGPNGRKTLTTAELLAIEDLLNNEKPAQP